jgi:hypothetical protein
MERRRTNRLNAEQVIAGCNAAWDRESGIAPTEEQVVRSPLMSDGVKSILIYLEPFQSCNQDLSIKLRLVSPKVLNSPVTSDCVAEGMAALQIHKPSISTQKYVPHTHR